MEMTIEKEAIEPTENLLVYENTQEIERIKSEAYTRINLFNTILAVGIERDQLDKIASSATSIEAHIESELIQANKEYARMVKAGIMVAVTLPENLQALKRCLEAFAAIRIQQGKYWLLEFDDSTNRFKLDQEAAERYFKRQQYKIYVDGEKLKELKTLLAFGEYLDTKAEAGQVFASHFLSQRYSCDVLQSCNALPKTKYMVKYSYFRQDRSDSMPK